MAQLTTAGITLVDPPGARAAVEGNVRTPGWLGGEANTLTARTAPGTGVHDPSPVVLHVSLASRQVATRTQGQRQAVAITVHDPLDVTRYTPPPVLKDARAVNIRHSTSRAGAQGVFFADVGARSERIYAATAAVIQAFDQGFGTATRLTVVRAGADKNTAVDVGARTDARSVALRLLGTTSNGFSTPDSAALSFPGDIDVRAKLSLASWTAAAAASEVIAKSGANGHKSWQFFVTALGKLQFQVSVDGTNLVGSASTATLTTADGATLWIRATWAQSTGQVNYYTSPDGVTWTLFSTRTAVVASIFDSDAPLTVGQTATGVSPMNGTLYYAEVRNGINGTAVATFDPTNRVAVLGTRNPNSFTGQQGNVWTAAGTTWDWAASGALPAHRTGVAGVDLLALVDAGGLSHRQRNNVAGFDYAAALLVGALSHRSVVSRAAMEIRTPPSNDNLVDRVNLADSSGTVTYSTVAATLELDEDPLDSRVVGPAGTVWYDFNQDSAGQLAVTAHPGDRVEAYIYTPPLPAVAPAFDPYPNHVQGWYDDTTDHSTWGYGYYQDAYVKLFRVVTTVDIPVGSHWNPMAQPSDQRTDGTGYYLELDLFVGNPGDPSHEGFGRNTGAQPWDRNDTYTTYTSLTSSGSGSSSSQSTLIPAGTAIWLLAQLWPDGSTPAAFTPIEGWDPRFDMGVWTDSSGNPFTPFVLADMTQVQLPVPSEQWELPPSAFQVVPGPSVFSNLTPAGGGDGSFVADVRPGEALALRIYPLNGNNPSDDSDLSWETVARPIDLTIPHPVTTVPGVLQIVVANETPGETLTFTVDDGLTVLETVVVDDDGHASAIIIVDDTMVDGDHLVHAISDTGSEGSASFTVSNDTVYYPPDPVDPPVDPTPPVVVNKWQFFDPTDNTTWAFPINPEKHDSLLAPRSFNYDHSSNPVGQHLVFEAMPKPKQWTCSGSLWTLADVEALKAWRKPYRVYLTDDFGRNLIVRVLNVQAKPVRSSNAPELHAYIVTCLLYGRV